MKSVRLVHAAGLYLQVHASLEKALDLLACTHATVLVAAEIPELLLSHDDVGPS